MTVHDISSHWRIKDGIILLSKYSFFAISNVYKKNSKNITYDEAQAFKNINLFGTCEPAFLESLYAADVIEPGEPGPDPILYDMLEKLDFPYIASYKDMLSQKELLAYDALLKIHSWYKRPLLHTGQESAIPETVLRRVLHVGDSERIGKKRIVCIGDDDFMSIALAMLGHHVTVYDVDPYILELIHLFAISKNLDIDIKEKDMREPLTPEECSQFNIFLTAPMSNSDCLTLFLSRAAALIEPHGFGYVAIANHVNHLLSKFTKNTGLMIQDWFFNHNHYYTSNFRPHGYTSDWVKIASRDHLTLKPSPETFCFTFNLYRASFFSIKRSTIAVLYDIEDLQHTTPFFLDLLLEKWQEISGACVLKVEKCHKQHWDVTYIQIDRGFISIYVNRFDRDITLQIQTKEEAFVSSFVSLFSKIFKSTATQFTTLQTGSHTNVIVF